MKFRMAENSLFAILLRSPWWMSVVLAGGFFAATRLVLPEFYAFFVALPFLAIGAYAGWRQFRAPSAARVAGTLEALRAMAWEEFSSAIENALRRDGYSVTRFAGAGADFELSRANRVSLLCCKRWKVARTGIEPLRELRAARAFAAEKNIRLVHGAELAKLLPRFGRGKKGTP